MKKIKAILTGTLLLGVAFLATAQPTAEKTLVKSFNLKGKQVVVLDLEGDIEVQEWNNDIMRIQMTIGLPNGSESMLKSLIRAGRYNLQSKVGDEDAYMVHAPGLNREVKIRGQLLKEHVGYIVYAPSGVLVKQAGDASTSSVSDDGSPSSL
ncbi:MAG: hypothetical protein AAGG75_18350 [Bacteroidota bacterium]